MMLLRAVFLAVVAAAFAGCSTSETFVIRPGSSWGKVRNRTPVEVVRRSDPTAPEVVTAAPAIATKEEMTFSGVHSVREALVALGVEYGLSPRLATASEQKAGFTEAISRPNGPAILLGESDLGTDVYVRVTGPSSPDTTAIRNYLRETTKAATAAVPTREKMSAEEFRKQNNLPPPLKKQ